MSVPSGRSMAEVTSVTAGMRSSRATIAAWASTPPRVVTTAAARASSGVQAGDVAPHTSTSPGVNRAKSSRPLMMRNRPRALPGLAGVPDAMVTALERGAHAGLRSLSWVDVIGRACNAQTWLCASAPLHVLAAAEELLGARRDLAYRDGLLGAEDFGRRRAPGAVAGSELPLFRAHLTRHEPIAQNADGLDDDDPSPADGIAGEGDTG